MQIREKAILFGASTLGVLVFNELQKDLDILFFCDNERKKSGSRLCNIPVVSPDVLLDENLMYDYIIISSSYIHEIQKQLDNMGLSHKVRFLVNVNGIDYNMNDDNISKLRVIEFNFTVIDSERDSTSKVDCPEDLIVDDHVYVDPRWEPVRYTSWDEVWPQDPFLNNTWKLRLHILEPIKYLLNAYEITRKDIYLLKAKTIIESWMKENIIIINSKNYFLSKSYWAWNDHAAADRIIYLMEWLFHFMKYDNDKSFLKLLYKSIMLHGYFLADKNNYSYYNHGIMQDRSLLLISTVFDTEEISNQWRECAVERVVERLEKDVSINGVYKEHSTYYHYFAWKLFKEILSFSESNRIPYITSFKKRVDLMTRYLKHILRNNGTLPQIGDSNSFKIDQYIECIEPMKESVFSCQDAGVIVVKNQADQLLFQAGFHSLIHKHADDCSFVFSKGDIDIFVDSGMYNYEERNVYRKYVRSTYAHNTVTVDNKSYEISQSNVGKSEILDFAEKDNIIFMRGKHTLYEGVVYYRSIFYFKEYSSLYILDEMFSCEQHEYRQIFNLGENVHIISLNSQKCLMNVDNKYVVEIIQLNAVTSCKEYKGNDDPLRGWISRKYNQITPTNSIDFINYSNNGSFSTIINTDVTGIKLVSRNGDKILFTFNNNVEIMYSL
ncbi:hypothetical protein BHU72_00255 [Desulfuribacillus stibiiarsenatis]|uniref:Uncharacterized protein n=1 Tax=Desulfuribacillus stibiiarsenatis TaxID=1390249 RepID=A0A1E5L9V1_9FIRM|nr:heparinase II/III family protein [Desulfuribacillus stibiiarsenatis]OEH86743.1 hypothetical protein BHU72_00255 [Desulfuribacillus stibiiarsenatis]